MPPSSRLINYRLRPAKHIERKMFIEIFRRLAAFDHIENYQYIGFGSWYFSDFYQFHKYLGIEKMISIERDFGTQSRYKFNLPFGCIELKFGDSNDILPALNWENRTILWLDYDGQLDHGVLKDIRHFCRNAASGSVILVTVNVGKGNSTLDFFKEEVENEKVPAWVTQKDMRPKPFPVVCHSVMTNEIIETLKERNGAKPSAEQFFYSQLCNLLYADGAQMLTIGGLIYQKKDDEKYNACSFEDLEFVKSSTQCSRDDLGILQNDAYDISVPNLTYKEIRHLNAQLPKSASSGISAEGIPEAELERYARIYRYFPVFADADI